ncbi:MAG: hypothetical protein J6R29_04995 [Clostridia bacterium]|nr:hypothetical protein [Clostridia bacterium]
MIRDEFKKIREEERLSAKEISGIRELGERAFYTSNLPKIISTLKGFNSLAITFLVLSIIMLSIFILYVVSLGKIGGSVGAWIAFISPIIMLTYSILWFTVFKRMLIKKHNRYKAKIAEISKREMQKQQAIYTKLRKVEK